jgi:hypothetical protein
MRVRLFHPKYRLAPLSWSLNDAKKNKTKNPKQERSGS